MANTTLQHLKELDMPKYLACLFVPEEKRNAFATLNVYAAELKRIPGLVSEPMPGEIRLQWWRDVISREGDASSPLASELLDVISEYDLPASSLIAMSEARIFDLYHDPMPDIAALETYLGETEAALIQLGGLILDPAHYAGAAEAAGHAGMAIGVAGILRQLASKTAAQRIYIPADILAAIGSSTEQLFNGDQTARGKAIAAMVALGRDHLKTFKRASKAVTSALRPAFLGVALCEPVFEKAEKLSAKAFENDILLPPLLTPIRIAYRAMRGW